MTKAAKPEEREFTPAFSRYRLPSVPQVMSVTADMAADWMDYRNDPRNRPLSKTVVARYEHDMRSGLWLSTPQGYSFDTDGYMIDGQHRARAQSSSGITLDMWVFPDQLREAFGVFDSGYKRAPGHMLPGPNAGQTAVVLRYLCSLADQDRWTLARFSRVTTPEILGANREWPEGSWYNLQTATAYRGAKIPMGAHGAILAMASRTEYKDKINDWLLGTMSGANLPEGDPRLTLRRKFQTVALTGAVYPRGKRNSEYAWITKAWNAFATGAEVRNLRFQETEGLPTVVGFDWNNPKGDKA